MTAFETLNLVLSQGPYSHPLIPPIVSSLEMEELQGGLMTITKGFNFSWLEKVTWTPGGQNVCFIYLYSQNVSHMTWHIFDVFVE